MNDRCITCGHVFGDREGWNDFGSGPVCHDCGHHADRVLRGCPTAADRQRLQQRGQTESKGREEN